MSDDKFDPVLAEMVEREERMDWFERKICTAAESIRGNPKRATTPRSTESRMRQLLS